MYHQLEAGWHGLCEDARMEPLPTLPCLALFRSHSEYCDARPWLARYWERDRLLRARLFGKKSIEGLCALCRKRCEFSLPAEEGADALRESLHCRGCGLNNRLRAAVALWLAYGRPKANARIYLSEQTTPLFAWLKRRFPDAIGSEYLGAERMPGESVPDPTLGALRHEDLTRLSFASESIEHLLCFDVLEHLPQHRPALGEFARVLVPGGVLVLSAPFDCEREDHEERARVAEDGRIEHLLPPIYHGDPLSPEKGILCYRTYGWKLLEELREHGFSESLLALVWSPGHGHLGWPNLVLLARRGGSPALKQPAIGEIPGEHEMPAPLIA